MWAEFTLHFWKIRRSSAFLTRKVKKNYMQLLLYFNISARKSRWTTNFSRIWAEFWTEKQLKWPKIQPASVMAIKKHKGNHFWKNCEKYVNCKNYKIHWLFPHHLIKVYHSHYYIHNYKHQTHHISTSSKLLAWHSFPELLGRYCQLHYQVTKRFLYESCFILIIVRTS